MKNILVLFFTLLTFNIFSDNIKYFDKNYFIFQNDIIFVNIDKNYILEYRDDSILRSIKEKSDFDCKYKILENTKELKVFFDYIKEYEIVCGYEVESMVQKESTASVLDIACILFLYEKENDVYFIYIGLKAKQLIGGFFLPVYKEELFDNNKNIKKLKENCKYQG